MNAPKLSAGVLRVSAAAKWLDCSPAVVRELIRLGRLPATLLNPAAKRPTYRISEADLLQFAAENRRPVLPPQPVTPPRRKSRLVETYERLFPE